MLGQLRPGLYSPVDWKIRKKLSPLEKWLHAFYASIPAPYPVRVETLLHLSGSHASDLKFFRRGLRTSLRGLVDVGFLVHWEIDDGDKVDVVKVSVT